MPVETQMKEWVGGSSKERSAWVGNINANATVIANHIVEILGDTTARLTMPRIDFQFGFSATAFSGQQCFNTYLASNITDEKVEEEVKEMIRNYEVVLPD